MKKAAWCLEWVMIALGSTVIITAVVGYAIFCTATFLLNHGYRGFDIPGVPLTRELLWGACVATGAWCSYRIAIHLVRAAASKKSQSAEREVMASQMGRLA